MKRVERPVIRRLCARVVIGCAVIGCTVSSLASPVHLTVDTGRGREFGAGYSARRGDDCLVLAPYHVVEWAAENGIRVTDTGGRSARASLLKAVEQFDAALLVLAGPEVKCGAAFGSARAGPNAIEAAEYLVAVKIDDSGRTRKTRLFARAVSNEQIELEPFAVGDALGEGDSGSALFAGDALVGMVLEIDTATGKVTAITANQLEGLFGADLASSAQRVIALAPFEHRNREDADATIAAREYLAALATYQLVDAPTDRRTRETLLPAGADFLVSGRVVRITPRRQPNPDYKPEQGRDAPNRYLVTYDVEVEIAILDATSKETTRNLERRQYKHVAPGGYLGDLEKSTVATAIGDALRSTLEKYPLPGG